jgi:alkylresorcinol/alkylpyrone synthase
MIPSLDAYLANTVEFSPHEALADHRTRLRRGQLRSPAPLIISRLSGAPVLVVAVELPSLPFQVHDLSPANIVSSALFGDGAAAVLLTGQSQAEKPRILATESTLFPHTTDLMGFALKDSGLHILLSAEIPEVVSAAVPNLVDKFLARQQLRLSDLPHFLLHPGGRRVLDGIVQCLALPEERVAVSRSILQQYGNLSSASVLFILDQFLTTEKSALET